MTIPTKTALGQEELKSRAHRLGQRHRTILLLVDGRRPLSEVLGLAQQAGAATSHFEDLVRLGLVDLPPEPEPPPPEPEPAPELAEEAQVTEVRLDVPVALEEALQDQPEAAAADMAPVDEAPVQAAPAAAPARPPVAPPPEALPVPPASPPREVPVLAEEAAVDSLQPVRNLLIETLRFDAPLFSARMFMRVRNAQTTAELIDLVWEIQDHLVRARRAQRELQSLQRARELLGLGNTLVSEDSTRPPHLDE